MTAMARPALLYFLLWLGVTLSTAMDLEKRIIGGHNCGDAEGLYHVKQRSYFNRTHYYRCGGSLIRDQWILTAAHCWKPGQNMRAYVNVHPGYQQEVMDIAPDDIHEEPNDHDIMLMKLPRRPNNIHTVDLPDCNPDIQLGNWVQVAGHGRDAIDHNNQILRHYPRRLQCATMHVVDCQPIQEKLMHKFPEVPYENFLCIQGDDEDTGKGDSGGGAVFNGRIYGVVSGGHATEAFKIPNFFMRVCSYMRWIQATIANHP